MNQANPYLPKRTTLNTLINEVHKFHGQEIYTDIGSGIARKKPVFRFIFAAVRLASRSRFLNMLMVSAVVLGYRILREPDHDAQIFQYGMSENNVAAFERLNRCLDPGIHNGICINGRRIPFWGRVRVVLGLRRVWQAARVLTAQRHATPLVHLQSVLATATALVFAMRPLSSSIQVVCVASDHSPICMALLAAARRQRRATCYLQHAPVTEHFPPLTHDLSILYDRASVEVYRRVARKRHIPFDEGAIALLPPFSEGFRAPQQVISPYTIGLCLSFLPDMTKIEALISSLSGQADVATIYLRRHPRCRQDWSGIASLPKVELRTQGEAGVDFFAAMDIALVPNSGVTIEALHYGRPTFFVPGTDMLPDDYYGFVAEGILPVFSQYVLKGPTAFFDSAWQNRFAQYDETAVTPLTELHAEACRAFMTITREAKLA